MKLKAVIVIGKHETKYGVDTYIRFVKKNESLNDAIEEIKNECGYDEDNDGEYFDADIEEVVINTDDFEIIEEKLYTLAPENIQQIVK